jgi:carboxypeptidase Taq
MAGSSRSYAELVKWHRVAATLSSVSQLLNWDQETYMPPQAAPFRAEQMSELARLVHERRIDPRVGKLISACERNGVMRDASAAANVREMRRDFNLATKLPSSLVAEIALAASQSQEVWKEAREKSDFSMFAPSLERMVALMRKKAKCLGVARGGEAYDALLDEHEPGMTAKAVEATFTPLRQRLADLIAEIARAKKTRRGKVSTKCLDVELDADAQHKFGLHVLEKMGFELQAGRLDTTTHPFCSGMAPGDTRLTTRYREERFTDALFGTLHEMGHGLYEQGLPKIGSGGKSGLDLYGTPLTEAISLGIHESQSRMWENFVGRGRAFWTWALPISKQYFGKSLLKYGVEDFYAAVNTTTPSLIRVEADEGTYNMHVMIRFEIERGLISGAMKVKEVPGEWNRRYKDYLGVKVPDDRRGCLQDVHWSFGLFGYFPTYTLGNLYAAQFWETIMQEIPDLEKRMAKGDFSALRAWLLKKIHRHGKRYQAAELCRIVTGKPLSADPLLRHLRGKAEAVYGI